MGKKKESKKEAKKEAKKEGKEKKKEEAEGKKPTYYCSVSQKMWCKVEKADKGEAGKFNLHYDCAGKKRKVAISGTDARVSLDKSKPTKACGGSAEAASTTSTSVKVRVTSEESRSGKKEEK